MSHYLFENQLFLKVETTIIFQVKTKCISLELLRKPIGSITPELWFDMFCSLLIKKGHFFSKKGPTDYNPNSFLIVTIQDWPKTSPPNAHCPLGTIENLNVVDIDINVVDSIC